jgi:hypothetical protein
MGVGVEVPTREFNRWNKQAQAEHLDLPDWMRTTLNRYVAEREEMRNLGAQPVRSAGSEALALHCDWCGIRIPTGTVRRRFCTDRCRVSAWRAARRPPNAESS